MKRMLSVVLAILLAVTLPVGVKAAEAADVLGDWYGNMFGISVTMTLEENGTYKMVMPIDTEDATEGTWELSGDKIILDGDESSALTIDGDTLSITEDDMSITFTREPAGNFSGSEPKTDAVLEDYAGNWIGAYVSMFGITIDTAMAGMDIVVTIDGNNVSMASGSLEINETIPFEFRDGALVVDADTLKTLAGESFATEGSSMKLQLQQDGTLCASLSYGSESVDFYMNPATEEEVEAAKAAAADGEGSEELKEAIEDVAEAFENAEEAAEEAVEEAIEGESKAE